MNRFGPTRQELKFRIGVSVAGFCLLTGAVAYRGWPTGPGGWEAIVIAALFFGGTGLWSLRKLLKGEGSDEL